MDPITQQGLAGSSGAGGDPLYVDDVFSTFLYKGTSSNQAISNGLDLSTEGGMVWLKARNQNYDHWVFDTERGVTKGIRPNETAGEYTLTDYFNSFNTNGFTVGSNGSTNYSGINFASWSFRKAPGFFDVVTFTGTGSAQNISHSLGSAPGMIVVKKVGSTDAGAWNVYHRSLGANGVIYLHATFGNSVDNGVWNNTAPTSSVFTVGADGGVNANGSTYVAYVFAHDEQSFGTGGNESIIKCGSFTTDGSSNATVDLGWEPQWILTKKSNASGNSWVINDIMRGFAYDTDPYLLADEANPEYGYNFGQPTATGFTYSNSPSSTYVYVAIRRPHKPPETATDVFAIDSGSSSSTIPTWDSGFPVDMAINHYPNSSGMNNISALRLLGANNLVPNYNAVLGGNGSLTWDSNVGWGKSYNYNAHSYMFRRAPGFFDAVTYTGTGSLSGVNHNLGVTPELKIIKSSSHSTDWFVGGSAMAGLNYGFLRLNTDGASSIGSSYWNSSSSDSATVFSVRNNNTGIDYSGRTYVAYLFASLSGVSKVGSYTGTGSNINVDCGFTAGARFVLIKRTDGGGGNWFIWDTFRGIASGNDPYFLLNEIYAQVTNTDFIDPLNAGFTVTSSAPSDLNASGGTYLYLAIA